MRILVRYGIVGCACAWLSACVTHDDSQPTMRTVRGDTAVVETLSVPETASVRLIGRVGDKGGAADALGAVWAFAVQDDRVLVFDSFDGIREFDQRGRFVRLIARIGEGPAEVRYVRAMAVNRTGELAVMDIGNRRISVFNGAGGVVTSPLGPGTARYAEDALYYDSTGVLWAGVPFRARKAGRATRPAVMRIRTDGLTSDTVSLPAEPYGECRSASDQAHSVGFWEDKRTPWIPKVIWAVGPAGHVVYGCSSDYAFVVVHPDGSKLKVSRPGYVSAELSAEQRQFVRDLVLGGGTAVPNRRPAYARFIVTAQGQVWVWGNQPLQPSTPSGWSLPLTGTFDVFDSDGTLRGVVPLPPEVAYSGYPTAPNIVIQGDTVWALALDSLDVQTVGKYLVTWPRGKH